MAKNGFLTFRAHESESDLFEKFLIIFLPMLEKFDKYAWHIEEDETPAKHIHCFFTHNYKDASKITQYFLNKDMKNLRKTFNQTQWQHAWDCQMVKDTQGDKMKTLGYTLKNICKRHKIKGLSAQDCLEAVNYYILTQRLDKLNTLDNDWKYITVKNIHNKIEHYCAHKKKSLHDEDIKEHMVLDKTSWVQISIKQYNLALAELRYHDNHCEEARRSIKSHGEPLESKIEDLECEIKGYQAQIAILIARNEEIRKAKTKTVIKSITHWPNDYKAKTEFWDQHHLP